MSLFEPSAFSLMYALGSAKPMSYSSYQEQRVTSTAVFSSQFIFIGCKTVAEKVIEIPHDWEKGLGRFYCIHPVTDIAALSVNLWTQTGFLWGFSVTSHRTSQMRLQPMSVQPTILSSTQVGTKCFRGMWGKDSYVLGLIFLLDAILVYSREGWKYKALWSLSVRCCWSSSKDLLDEKAGTLEDTQLLFGDSARI